MNREGLINTLKTRGVRLDFEYMPLEQIVYLLENTKKNENVLGQLLDPEITNVIQIHNLKLKDLAYRATLIDILKQCALVNGKSVVFLTGELFENPTGTDIIVARSFVKFIDHLARICPIFHIGDLTLFPEITTLVLNEICELSENLSYGKMLNHKSIGFVSDYNINLSLGHSVFDKYAIYVHNIDESIKEIALTTSYGTTELVVKNTPSDNFPNDAVLYCNLSNNKTKVVKLIHDEEVTGYDHINGNESDNILQTILGRIKVSDPTDPDVYKNSNENSSDVIIGRIFSQGNLRIRPNIHSAANLVYEKIIGTTTGLDTFAASVAIVGEMNKLLSRQINGVIAHKYDPILHKYYKYVKII